VSISIEVARRVMDACKRRALELRSPVSIAIVDAGGHLVLFERMMSPYGWATGKWLRARPCSLRLKRNIHTRRFPEASPASGLHRGEFHT